MNFVAPVNDLSYGIVTKNLVQEFPEAALLPIGPIDGFHNLDNQLKRQIGGSELFHEFKFGPSIRIWHASDMTTFNGNPKIGFPIFELDTFTEGELKHLNNCDMLVACSEYAKEVYERNGLNKPIIRTHLGVNQDIFKPMPTAKPEKITFLNVGKWEVRKGHDVLHHAFEAAFSEQDDVELWMSATNRFMDCSHWENDYRETLGDKFKSIGWMASQQQLAELMNIADVGVFPSRSEGWGFPIIEMMSCDKDVITVNATGPKDYANDENAIMIEPTEKVLANDGFWFKGQGSWYDFSFNDLVEGLRIGYERAKQRRDGTGGNGTNSGRIRKSVSGFTWRASAELIRRGIGES